MPSGGLQPEAAVRSAVSALSGFGVHVEMLSPLYASPAFPPGSGPPFVNGALAVSAEARPRELLDILHRVEARYGRVRTGRWQPRALDLDLIAAGAAICPDTATWRHWQGLPPAAQRSLTPDRLILPHPRMADRAFVLVPLADIAPDWRHPVTGDTVAEMCAGLPERDRAGLRKLPGPPCQ